MRAFVLVLTVVVGAGLVAGPVALQERLVVGDSPYNVVDGWMKPFAEAGSAWGSHPGVYAESADRIFVMSSRPGRILVERKVDLPRPRELDLCFTPEFTSIVHELRGHISEARA